MIGQMNRWIRVGVVAGLLLVGGRSAFAQYGGNQAPRPTPTAPPEKNKPQDLSLEKEKAPAPVNAEEDAAFKAYESTPSAESAKKIEMGEAFVQKYPQSRYLPLVYSSMTFLYMQAGQVPKMLETGEKEIALNPNDVQTLALLGQAIPRAFNPSAPDAAKQLDKAEQYSKRALEVTPTMPKPEHLTDDAFASAKNQTMAMAHSGLGLVDVRRGKFGEAIPELEQAVKIDPTPDPVNYYLLGLANQKTSHFEDAAAAFNKCAAAGGSLQATCKNGAEEAKKLAATQLSAPK